MYIHFQGLYFWMRQHLYNRTLPHSPGPVTCYGHTVYIISLCHAMLLTCSKNTQRKEEDHSAQKNSPWRSCNQVNKNILEGK